MDEYPYFNAEHGCSSCYVLPQLRAMLRSLPPRSVIADIGCGNGAMLAELQGRQWELHGFDVSRSGLREAARAYPGVRFEYADFGQAIPSHPLAGRCDVVISTEVIEHVFLPRVFLKNCHLLLRPGGTLIVSTPYHGYLKNLVLAITGRLDRHFTALWDYGHIKFWSRRTLKHLLEEAGFTVTRFIGAGRVPWVWRSMILTAEKAAAKALLPCESRSLCVG